MSGYIDGDSTQPTAHGTRLRLEKLLKINPPLPDTQEEEDSKKEEENEIRRLAVLVPSRDVEEGW